MGLSRRSTRFSRVAQSSLAEVCDSASTKSTRCTFHISRTLENNVFATHRTPWRELTLVEVYADEGELARLALAAASPPSLGCNLQLRR